MAQIGLRYLRYSILDSKDEVTKMQKLAPVVEMKVTLNKATGKLYGDDVVVESDTQVTGYNVEVTVTDDPEKETAELLGHEYDESEKEVIKYADDEAPYAAVGGIKVKVVNGKRKYKGEFYPKVKFEPYVSDGKTMGDGIEYQTPTLQGTGSAVEMKNSKDETKMMWSRTATFENFELASKWLDDLLEKE